MNGMLLKIVVAPFVALGILLLGGCAVGSDGGGGVGGKTIDHRCAKLSAIPQTAINQAKSSLHIAYGHTSHGNQLIVGMNGIVGWSGGGAMYSYNDGGAGGALDLRNQPFSGASDLGNPNYTAWEAATRDYLDSHAEINVVIWSWCGQADTTAANINLYLSLMSGLEASYPGVTFVYMTGHLNGSGLSGNLHLRNQQIRDYCSAHDKFLYDFEDIESYDPDGTYFGDKNPHDTCEYDLPGGGSGNWAVEWQNAHTETVDWFNCSPDHTQPVNGNLKGFAAWWLWARIAGWEG